MQCSTFLQAGSWGAAAGSTSRALPVRVAQRGLPAAHVLAPAVDGPSCSAQMPTQAQRHHRRPLVHAAVAAPATAAPPAQQPEPTSSQQAAQGSGSITGVAGMQMPLSFAGRHGLHDSSGRLLLKNLTLSELEEWCASIGEAPKRARQLYKALYGSGLWVRDLDEMDGDSRSAFSAAFKAKVRARASLSGGLQLQSVHTARDGTHKLVFALVGEEGGTTGTVETVLIPMTNRQGGNLRYTACLSTQVGCAMNCQFCYTGRLGLLGNLSTAQVVEQVVEARRWLAEQAALATTQLQQHQQQEQDQVHSQPHAANDASADLGQAAWQAAAAASGQRQAAIDATEELQPPVPASATDGPASSSLSSLPLALQQATGSRQSPHVARGKSPRFPVVRPIPIANIVFMGMGEPLHNYDVVMAAIDVLAEGLELSRNKIIVSTVGLADGMRAFLAANKAKLALSLHATTDAVRDWIVPQNRRHPIGELMGVLRQHFPREGAKGDKFVVLEYVLLAGVNDTPEDAQRLVELTRDIYCMINLIVFNPHDGTPFQRSSDDAVRTFRGILLEAGRVCTVRVSKGDDEMAACGQLGDIGQARKRVPVVPPPESLLKGMLAGVAAMQAAAATGSSNQQ